MFFVCFDWLFPETARMLALKGAQIIAHPSNLVLDYCQKAMYCRCIENGVFAITANRIGTEDRAGRTLNFTGGSQVLDSEGETLVAAPSDTDCVESVEIDPWRADEKRIADSNDRLKDRRGEIYGILSNYRE